MSTIRFPRPSRQVARGGLRRLASATVLVAALAVPFTAPASAAAASTTTDGCATQRAAFLASPTLANAKALGDCMAAIRLEFLGKATGRVQSSKVLTSADRGGLLSILSGDTNGITSLKSKLDAETTVKATIADARSMVVDYRVFLLGGRQVALVIGVDAVGAVASHFDTVHQKLETLIDAAAAQGRDVTAARASLAAMDASVVQARADVGGLSAKLLALTPAEYDAGTAGPVLDGARASLRAARDSLVAARKDAAAVLEDLGR
ncbi:MAG TPA: hypothetical protein VEY67_07420 [Candidatus Dormibacteraeota bacterium]|nr:hypothetical protein [Candidatus Dormibacteraeota bacterium]